MVVVPMQLPYYPPSAVAPLGPQEGHPRRDQNVQQRRRVRGPIEKRAERLFLIPTSGGLRWVWWTQGQRRRPEEWGGRHRVNWCVEAGKQCRGNPVGCGYYEGSRARGADLSSNGRQARGEVARVGG